MASSKARKNRRLLERINRAAEERRKAWSESGHPNATEASTSELDQLYASLRSERRGVYAVRPEWEGDAYRGKISAVSRRAS